MSEAAVGSAAAEGSLDALRLPLISCLAGLDAALTYARVAADAWSEGADTLALMDAADGALARARGQAAGLRQVLPGHSRRVRLADRAVERVTDALAAVRGLLPLTPLPLSARLDPDDDAVVAEQAVLTVVERAFGTAERAVLAAAPDADLPI